jgi:DNA-binding response OmpR family regulator
MSNDGVATCKDAASPRLLIVEDEALVMMLIEDNLIASGYDVAARAASVEQALTLIEATPIDAALLDLNLGGGQTSLAVAERLAAVGIPFLFLTGYGETRMVDAFPSAPLLGKPFLRRELEAAVAGLLSRPVEAT